MSQILEQLLFFGRRCCLFLYAFLQCKPLKVHKVETEVKYVCFAKENVTTATCVDAN